MEVEWPSLSFFVHDFVPAAEASNIVELFNEVFLSAVPAKVNGPLVLNARGRRVS